MSNFLTNIGHALGGALQKAAPVLGMVPGVGTLAGGALGGLGGLLAPGGNIGEALKGGAEGAAGGLISKIPGVGDMLGKVGSTLGGSLGNTFMPGGKLDLGKVISAGSTIAGLVGQNQQRKSAENYNNSQIDQRNALMGQVMGPQNYNLPDISSQVNKAAGPKITPAGNPGVAKSMALTGGKAPNLNQQQSAS